MGRNKSTKLIFHAVNNKVMCKRVMANAQDFQTRTLERSLRKENTYEE